MKLTDEYRKDPTLEKALVVDTKEVKEEKRMMLGRHSDFQLYTHPLVVITSNRDGSACLHNIISVLLITIVDE